MSRHEGVSCDACLRSNFRGRRYKCLVCYDYDLCASCHEAGATTTRHAAEHPMQCILTRSDFELYFSGEAISSEQPQSFVCPHCGKMGLTELTLADHVTAQHAEATTQVVCPVCASVPNGEPNHVTEDLTAHLSVDHGRTGSASSGSGAGGRDLISFGEEPGSGSRQTARRVPHPSRSVGGPRMRRFNMHFRESMDPITELLSQLSGVRRAGGSTSASSSSSAASAAANAASEAAGSAGASSAALQQLQMHLQLERQQYAQVVRQQTERTPRRQAEVSSGSGSGGGQQGAPGSAPASSAAVTVAGTGAGKPLSAADTAEATSQFLLCRIRDEEDADVDMARRRRDRADRAIFAQEIVLSTLSKSLEECAAMSEGGAAVAAAAPSPSGSNSPSQPGAEAGAARPAAAAAPPNGAKPAAVSAPAAGATAAPPVAPRQVGAAARSAAAAVSVGGVLNGAGRGARGGGVRGLVGVPTAAVSQLGPRVVPVRGRRKPARPAAAGPLDGRGGAMPAADPPPPH